MPPENLSNYSAPIIMPQVQIDPHKLILYSSYERSLNQTITKSKNTLFFIWRLTSHILIDYMTTKVVRHS